MLIFAPTISSRVSNSLAGRTKKDSEEIQSAEVRRSRSPFPTSRSGPDLLARSPSLPSLPGSGILASLQPPPNLKAPFFSLPLHMSSSSYTATVLYGPKDLKVVSLRTTSSNERSSSEPSRAFLERDTPDLNLSFFSFFLGGGRWCRSNENLFLLWKDKLRFGSLLQDCVVRIVSFSSLFSLSLSSRPQPFFSFLSFPFPHSSPTHVLSLFSALLPPRTQRSVRSSSSSRSRSRSGRKDHGSS